MEQNILLENGKLFFIKLIYGLYGCVVIVVGISLLLANIVLQTKDYNIVGFVKLGVNCINIFVICASSCISAHIIYKVSKGTTGFNETFNKKMFYINFGFCALFILSEVVFLTAIGNEITARLIIGVYFYEYLRVFMEFLILYLASVYGEQMLVTS